MNLIEQLGGYEKAKEIVFDPLHPQMTHVSNDGRHWVNENFSYIPEIQSQIPKMARIDDIRKALLEYRRQHNIFEVGDKVVSKNGCELVSEITYLQGGLAKIKNEKFDHVYSLQDFRHAEPEEIKAGKRLEVNQ